MKTSLSERMDRSLVVPPRSVSGAPSKWLTPTAVGAAALLLSQVASGAVVFSGILNHQVPVTNQGTVMNLVTGTLLNGPTSSLPGWDVNPYGTSASNVALVAAAGTGIMRNPGAGTNTFRTSLAVGTLVGPASFFYGNSAAMIGTEVGQWTANSEGYFGLKFVNESSNTTHYGFVALRIGANATVRTIVGYGYETTANTPIFVSSINVPAPAAGLISLVACCGSRRRRR
jgi:hypothetical protein